MPASSPVEEHLNPARPLLARLLAPAAIPVQRDGTATRWTLYTGALVQTLVYGVNQSRLINLIIDLSTLTSPAKIPALAGHIAVPTAVLGDWTKISQDAEGLGADFTPLVIPAEAVDLFNSARAISALLAAKIPLQASVGVEPGPAGEYVRLTAPTTVNGMLIDPAQYSDPVFVLRGGLLTEGSVVLFGADNQTGPRLAALAELAAAANPSAHHSKDHPMQDRLKTLLAKFPDHVALVAQRLADGADDTAIADAVTGAKLSALTTERDTLKAESAALTQERDALKTELATAKAEIATLKARRSADMPQGGEGSDAPLRRSQMSRADKAAFQAKHGIDAYIKLPE
jgi:hypothetical protein